MKSITLTTEELAQIESQRKMQMELDAKREAAYEVDFQKEVVRAKEEMNKFIGAQNAQVDMAKKCAIALGLTATITWHNKEAKAYKRHMDGTRSVEWSETYKYPSAVIVDGDHRIDVRMHTVYSKWSIRGTDKGYKMYISGPEIDYKTSARGYVNAKKVLEVIKDAKDTMANNQSHEARLKSAIESTITKFSTQFPDAKVVSCKEYNYNPHSRNNKYTHYDCVKITLPNGIVASYQVYADGTLTRTNFEFPRMEPKMEATDFLSIMSNLKF